MSDTDPCVTLPARQETGSSTPHTETHPIPDVGQWPRSIWAMLIVLCGALFLDALDVSMIGVALPSMGRSLELSAASLQWIVSGYVLGYGGLLLLGGRASDLLGRRAVFLTAVAVFGAASVISAFLSNNVALISLRFVKGAAAAFTVPAGLSILTTTFAEGPARSKALGIYTVSGASGFSLGLVFGGVLTEIGWRACLFTPGPIALALVVAGARVIPMGARERVTLKQFDLAGAFTITSSLLILVFAVVQAPTRGWQSTQTIGLLALSAVLMAAFVVIELRHPHPLVRLDILRSASLIHANIAGAVMLGSYIAFQFVATLYVQNSLGWTPFQMALGFLPTSAIIVVAAPFMGNVLERFHSAKLTLYGMALLLVAYALFLRVQPSMSYASFLLPTMVLIGVGSALVFPAVNSQATAGVHDSEQGLASGLLNTSMQISGAVLLAITSAILANSDSTARAGQLMPGMSTALIVDVGVTALGVLAALFGFVSLRGRKPDDGSHQHAEDGAHCATPPASAAAEWDRAA